MNPYKYSDIQRIQIMKARKQRRSIATIMKTDDTDDIGVVERILKRASIVQNSVEGF